MRLRAGADLAAEVGRLCAAAGIRPVLIRRHGRQDRSTARRWALVDCRPGQESVRWGELSTDDHLLNVLAGRDPGTPSADPIYLICTHGRHDACCAIRGRPAAAALSTAFPDQTWECSHIGGDRFAANLVFLPHSLFYGHVPSTEAVNLAAQYNEGLVVPKYLRGSGAYPPPVQAAQHFARSSGAPLSINALHPTQVTTPTPTTWQIHLSTTSTTESRNADTNPNATASGKPPENNPNKPTATANATTKPNPDASTSTQPGTNASASITPDTGVSASTESGTNASASNTPDTGVSASTEPGIDANASNTPDAGVSASTESGIDASASITPDAGVSASTESGIDANASPNGGTGVSGSDKATEDDQGEASGSIGGNADASAGVYVVTLTAGTTTIDAAMTCAAQPPGHVTTYTLTGIEQAHL